MALRFHGPACFLICRASAVTSEYPARLLSNGFWPAELLAGPLKRQRFPERVSQHLKVGTVKLSRIRPFCGRILLDQRLRINDLAVAAGGENAAKLLNLTVPGQESLCLPGRFEPAHLSLALPCGLVGDFGAIVLVSVRAMGDGRHDRSVRSPVVAQLVGDQPPRRTLLALQQLAEKACSRPTVATRLDEDIDDVTILIDGTPEIAPLSLDGDEDLVHVPDVAQPALSTLEPASVY